MRFIPASLHYSFSIAALALVSGCQTSAPDTSDRASQNLAASRSSADAVAPVDPSVSRETFNLLQHLHRIGWDPDKIMFGQEFPLSFNYAQSFNTDLEQSDSKDITGQHPGVHGSDFHYIIYPRAQDERGTHIAAARAAYRAGAVVTFDFHWNGKYSDEFYYKADDPAALKDAELLYNVVNGDDSDGDVTWFYQSLDTILAVINDELEFPIVFRPLHEMNGNWFWWGSKMKGGPEVFQQAFRMMVDYMSERTEYVLFSWSPDKAIPMEYYPGDEYVDVIGIDGYDAGVVDYLSIKQMVDLLAQTVTLAEERGKVAAFTETGNRVNYPDGAPTWWTENVLRPILQDDQARRIAWILTWINAQWSGPYVPAASSNENAKADFKAFADHPVILFQDDVAAEKVYSK